MATLTGSTFTISVPGWADGKDGDTSIVIEILNSNGIKIASFSKSGAPEWPIDKNQSYSDGVKLGSDKAQLQKELLQKTIVKVTKNPTGGFIPGPGNDSVTFNLSFVFTFDDNTTQKSDVDTSGGQEDVIRMLDGGQQTVSRNFAAH